MQITTRFEDAPWFKGIQSPCTVIGAGSIGSWLTLFLSRAGAKVHLWDDDQVEIHNVGGQFYKKDQEGYKVECTKNNCIEYGATGKIITYKEKFRSGSVPVGVVFSCVDNMKARRDIFKQVKLCDLPLLIDGGLYMEDWHVIEVTKGNMSKYKEYLESNGVAQPPSCTYKTTTAIGAACAADMFAAYINFLTNQSEPDEREHQYITEYTSINRRYSTR